VTPALDELPLLLAGELGNSNASDPLTLQRLWPRLVELRLNTVLAPVSWELVEPEAGVFRPTTTQPMSMPWPPPASANTRCRCSRMRR
jgi:hypothetical protein